VIDNKKILDVTCGSRTMWFNKNHPDALYTDIRKERHENYGRVCDVNPDVIADFTELPFEDESFYLVVFDPPHMKRLGENAWFAKKYGRLFPTWETDIRAGVEECMRVLKPNGVLIFKWSDVEISVNRILDVINHTPLFGHSTGNSLKTTWMTFMK